MDVSKGCEVNKNQISVKIEDSEERVLISDPLDLVLRDDQSNNGRNIDTVSSDNVELEETPEADQKVVKLGDQVSSTDVIHVESINPTIKVELDDSCTNLRSLSESLVEVANSSTDGNSTLCSLVAYDASDEGSEGTDAEESGSEDSSVPTSSSTSASDSSDEESARGSLRQTTKEKAEVEEGIPEPPKTKREVMLQDLPEVPYVDFRLADDEEVALLGKVSSIIGQLVVVASNKDTPALNEETVLFKADRHPIGVVFELFGPVPTPFYTVRFNSAKDITELGLTLGSDIYFAPKREEITKYVFVKQLRAMKGSDASWANDEEPPREHVEYSDDEQEREAKKVQTLAKEKRKSARRREEGISSSNPQVNGSSRHQQDLQGNMNVDDRHGDYPHNSGPPHWPHGHQPHRPPFSRPGPQPPFHQRDPRPPFSHSGPQPSFEHNGPRPPFEHNGPRPPFEHNGPRPPFEHNGPHPSFNYNGPRPPFENTGPRPPFDHHGPRPPFGNGRPHPPYSCPGPPFNQGCPPPPRQSFPGHMGYPRGPETFHRPMQPNMRPPDPYTHRQFAPPNQFRPNIPPRQGGMYGHRHPPPHPIGEPGPPGWP